MEEWNVGMMEYWNDGMVGISLIGELADYMMEYWNIGIM
jgi:hypothetical protein